MKKLGLVLLCLILAMSVLTVTACGGLGDSDTKHTVTFVTNNGSSPKTSKVADGQTVSKPSNPTRSGFDFEGWYETLATEPFDFNTPITKDITLTARWSSYLSDSIGDMSFDNVTINFTGEMTGFVGSVDGYDKTRDDDYEISHGDNEVQFIQLAIDEDDYDTETITGLVKIANGVIYTETDGDISVLKDNCYYNEYYSEWSDEWYYSMGYSGVYGADDNMDMYYILSMVTDLSGLGIERINDLPWVITKNGGDFVYTYQLDIAKVANAAISAVKNGINKNQYAFDFLASLYNAVAGAMDQPANLTGKGIKQSAIDLGNTTINELMEQSSGYADLFITVSNLFLAAGMPIESSILEEFGDLTLGELFDMYLQESSSGMPFILSFETMISMIGEMKVKDLISMFGGMILGDDEEEEPITVTPADILQYLDMVKINKYSAKLVGVVNAEGQLVSLSFDFTGDIKYDGEQLMDITESFLLEFSDYGTTVIDYAFDKDYELDGMEFVFNYGEAYEMKFYDFGFTYEIHHISLYYYGDLDYEVREEAKEFLMGQIVVEDGVLYITLEGVELLEELGVYNIDVYFTYYAEGSTEPAFDGTTVGFWIYEKNYNNYGYGYNIDTGYDY